MRWADPPRPRSLARTTSVAPWAAEAQGWVPTEEVEIVTQSGTRNGRTYEGRVTHVLHLRDGKVTEFWDAYVDQYTADEFWS